MKLFIISFLLFTTTLSASCKEKTRYKRKISYAGSYEDQTSDYDYSGNSIQGDVFTKSIPQPYHVSVDKYVPTPIELPQAYKAPKKFVPQRKLPEEIPIHEEAEVPEPNPYTGHLDEAYPLGVSKPGYLEEQVPVYVNNDASSGFAVSYQKKYSSKGVSAIVTHHGV